MKQRALIGVTVDLHTTRRRDFLFNRVQRPEPLGFPIGGDDFKSPILLGTKRAQAFKNLIGVANFAFPIFAELAEDGVNVALANSDLGAVELNQLLPLIRPAFLSSHLRFEPEQSGDLAEKVSVRVEHYISCWNQLSQ